MTACLQFCANAEVAPPEPGAYMLQIDLAETVWPTIGGRIAGELRAGRYIYCGSAYGSGGLKARLARHMRRGKSVRWHVDQLTERGIVGGSWILRDGCECDLVALLAWLPIPIAGFGSSDCARCRSHLLSWPDTVSDRARLARLLTRSPVLGVRSHAWGLTQSDP